MKVLKFFPGWNLLRWIQICCLFICAWLAYVECKYEFLIHHSNELCSDILCNKIKCEKVENCSGVILPKASYCGCCSACVSYFDISSPCEETQASLTGLQMSKCKEGLKCENNKCVLDRNGNLNRCLIHKYLRSVNRGNGNYTEDLWVPECDEKGDFKANQEKGRRSLCLDKYGERIMGAGGKDSENACACSRHMQLLFTENPLSYNVEPQQHCSTSGNFEKLQCQNNLCYCADQGSGKAKGRLVRRDNLDKLSCYEDGISTKKYLKPCEEELQRSRRLAYEFYLKGVILIGVHNVKCDPDGSFSPKQCQPDRCVCTDPHGVGIGSYAISMEDLTKLDNITMTCNCAREEGSTRSSFHCKGFGNYAYVQCFNSDQCYCVDDDGDIISKSLPKTTVKEDYCRKLLHNLLLFPEDGFRSTATDSEETEYDYNYDYANEHKS